MADPAASSQTAARAATWVFDPAHSIAEFSVRHMMIATVKGRFKKMEGKIVGDPADPSRASVELSIDVNSIDTGEPQRDTHLRSPDFFDAEHHPTLTFRSRRIERVGDDRLRVVGDLTMRGVTKEVPVDVTFDGQGKDPWGNERSAFSAETRVNRKEFGLNWNTLLETGGVLVGDEVRINVHVEAIKQG
ncbi:MAG: YceI family protein [Bacillota bacterium]